MDILVEATPSNQEVKVSQPALWGSFFLHFRSSNASLIRKTAAYLIYKAQNSYDASSLSNWVNVELLLPALN